MSYDDDELDEVTPEPQALDPNIRKQLREAEKLRKELDSAKAELEAQRREVQFSKAGIPDTGLGSLFRKAYDGDTSTEAIRQAAEEYGILQSQAPAPVTNHTDAEIEALRRAQGATVGTSGQFPDTGNEYLTALASASSPEDVLRIVEGELGRKLGLSSNRVLH